MSFLERQNKERTIHLNKLETLLQEPKVEDETDLFFKTMSASVKKFPGKSRASVKMKISQIVFEEETRLSELHASSSMTTFNYSDPQYDLTSPESVSSPPSSSAISNISYESNMSETVTVPTPSPDVPPLHSGFGITQYWQSYNGTNTNL